MSDPADLGEGISALLRSLRMPDPASWERLVGAWERVAGPPWTEHTRPGYLRAGELVVEVLSPRAVPLLRYGVEGLRTRLEAELGAGIVESIRLETGGGRGAARLGGNRAGSYTYKGVNPRAAGGPDAG